MRFLSSQRPGGLILAILLGVATLAAAQADLTARVTYVADGGVYIDAGSDQGLRPGAAGTVLHEGTEIARVEVAFVSQRSARLQVVARTGDAVPVVGDLVQFAAPALAEPPTAPEEETKPPTPAPKNDTEFVPLLERQKAFAGAKPVRNVCHGWVSLDQVVQVGSGDLDYFRTLLSTAGGVDRLMGKMWAFRWSGSLGIRGGDAFSNSTLEGAELDVYELAAVRPFEGGGQLMLGRFVTPALSAVGYMDGATAEREVAPGVRVGGLLGFKPDRQDLSVSSNEPTALAYGTMTSGTRADRYYSGTLGILASMWKGDFDRCALLGDQHLGFDSKLFLDLAFQVDFDVGAGAVNTGTHLTQLDFVATGRLSDAISLRGGVDHYETLDTAAVRDSLLLIDPTPILDSGNWRYWGGFSARVRRDLRLDGEVSMIDSDATGETWHWYATLTWLQPFALSQASAWLTVYNLDGQSIDGLGGQLGAYLPVQQGRLSLQPFLQFRAFESSGSDFTVTDVRLYGQYRFVEHWTLRGGVAYTFGDDADHTILEIQVTYRW